MWAMDEVASRTSQQFRPITTPCWTAKLRASRAKTAGQSCPVRQPITLAEKFRAGRKVRQASRVTTAPLCAKRDTITRKWFSNTSTKCDSSTCSYWKTKSTEVLRFFTCLSRDLGFCWTCEILPGIFKIMKDSSARFWSRFLPRRPTKILSKILTEILFKILTKILAKTCC